MRRPPSAKIASLGVTQTKLAIEKLDWLFREQPTEDYGIDAQVEVVDGDVVEGKLIALQIKSGMRWFKDSSSGGWWYRPNAEHVKYWLNHSLPVVIVLFHPQTELCHWQLVTTETLVKTASGGWKMLIPTQQVLDESARISLHEAAEGDPYVLRIRELQLDRQWMRLLAGGKRLVIDIEEWINKSSGRGAITLGVDNEDGRTPAPLAKWGVLLGRLSYAVAVTELFPWADVIVHEATYDQADYERYETECVIVDSEGDRFVTQDFNEWSHVREATELRPYANEAGEVDLWRLELTLNELGKSFRVVDEFVTKAH
jgi:hypothetical protein